MGQQLRTGALGFPATRPLLSLPVATDSTRQKNNAYKAIAELRGRALAKKIGSSNRPIGQWAHALSQATIPSMVAHRQPVSPEEECGRGRFHRKPVATPQPSTTTFTLRPVRRATTITSVL